jgi:ATP-dependent DNA helicase RecQ
MWTTFEVEPVAQCMEVSREKVVAAIHYLEEAGDLVVQRAGIRQGYRVLSRKESPRELADRMQALFERREAQDIARLHRVVQLAEEAECLTRGLLEYFGEEAEAACGHCSRCRGGRSGPLPRSGDHEFTHEEMETVQALAAERLPALRTARQMTRFLCGLTSPAATRARLSRRDEFGVLERVSFPVVLEWVETLILP